jgi:hypothetical protein
VAGVAGARASAGVCVRLGNACARGRRRAAAAPLPRCARLRTRNTAAQRVPPSNEVSAPQAACDTPAQKERAERAREARARPASRRSRCRRRRARRCPSPAYGPRALHSSCEAGRGAWSVVEEERSFLLC